jgi:hypothetical protein
MKTTDVIDLEARGFVVVPSFLSEGEVRTAAKTSSGSR